MRAKPTRSARLLALVAVALAALFMMPTTVALHCNGEITAHIVAGQGFYIDDRSDKAGEINHWTYLETNGRAGLQSGEDDISSNRCDLMYALVDFCLGDPCEHADPDTLIL